MIPARAGADQNIKNVVENKKPLAISVFCGALAAVAHPHASIEIAAWIAFVLPILFSVIAKTNKAAFLQGYAFGLIYFSILIYWVIYATAWGALLVLILPLFYGALFVFMRMFVSLFDLDKLSDRTAVLFGVPALWVIMEYIRNYIATGFPWGQVGYSQFKDLALIQIVSVTGIYGVTFIVILANTALALLVISLARRSPKQVAFHAALVLLIGVSVFLLKQWGGDRINRIDSAVNKKIIKVGIIQGNIPLGDKWDSTKKTSILDTYLELSEDAANNGADIIIWPETSIPGYYRLERQISDRIRAFVEANNVDLIAGALDTRIVDGKKHYYNSVFHIGRGGVEEQSNKIRLVPFGEYVPLWMNAVFPFIQKVVLPGEDFSPGRAYKLFQFYDSTRCGALVCYEDIFPQIARRLVKNGADFLVNITNDAWFRKSSSTYQHLSMAVMRAVENGTDVIRVANTGLSCFISKTGSVHLISDKKSAIGSSGSRDGLFTRESKNRDIDANVVCTQYTRHGDVFVFLAGGCLMLMVLLKTIKKLKKGREERLI